MALVFFNRFVPPIHASPLVVSTSRPPFRCSLSAAPVKYPRGNRGGRSDGEKKPGTVILWFKHDLRVDDHVGLVSASNYEMVLPLYVFDRRILSRFSEEMVEHSLFALNDLRQSLREQGSNLMIRFGDSEYVLQEIAKEVKASVILSEEEVEYNVRAIVDRVRRTLENDPFLDSSLSVTSWRNPFYDVKKLDHLPALFTDLKKLQFSEISPLSPPKLPRFAKELDWGNMPTVDDVRKFICRYSSKERASWDFLKETPAEIVLSGKQVKFTDSSNNGAFMSSKEQYKNDRRKRLKNSVFHMGNGNVVAGGTDVVLNALAAYLRYTEETARDDWQEVHRKLQETETRAGASFGTLFGPSLELGVISRRRVYYEAKKYESERNACFLSPFGYSTASVAAVVDTACSMEWHWLLTLKSLTKEDGFYPTMFWRWNGYLIQYTVVGHDGPSTLLVHGFGAFLEHYRDNMKSIADEGNRVWALTLLGFGKSEKPNIVYTELLWAELIRDFIIDVVGEPVHLVGNSVGGYFSAIVCGFWPSLAKSVVLINSAGEVVSWDSSLSLSKQRETPGFAWLGARVILQYLRFSLRSIVKNCYPTRPERADDCLLNEMLRASYDPGVISVLESVFSFNLSIPLKFLLAKMNGRILIIQGMKDPIADSGWRLAMFREHCVGIDISELDAGHCPHDECPEEVNSIICKWILKKNKEINQVESYA